MNNKYIKCIVGSLAVVLIAVFIAGWLNFITMKRGVLLGYTPLPSFDDTNLNNQTHATTTEEELFFKKGDLPDFGVTLKYPSSFVLKEDSYFDVRAWSLYKPNASTSLVLISVFTKNLKYYSFVSNVEDRTTLLRTISADLSGTKEVRVGDKTGYEGLFTNSYINYTEKQIWVEGSTYIYKFSFQLKDEKEVKAILSSAVIQ